jgi:hypothetical protein
MNSKRKALVILSSFGILAGGVGFTYSSLSDNKTNVHADTGTISENHKAEIQDKMVNSIDYFTSAKGSYHYYTEHSKADYTVDFDVNVKGSAPVSYTKIKKKDASEFTMIYDGNEVLQADSKTKKFKKMPVFKDDNNSSQASPAKQRYYKGPDGKVQGVKLRKDPAYMGAATEILFNQNIALGFLEDYSKWKIDSEEQLNGFYAIVLSGELESNYKEKHKAETFKIWTHKDTGIMLKMEEYNKQGKVVYSIATQNLELNKPVDYNKIQFTSPANFTEIKE